MYRFIADDLDEVNDIIDMVYSAESDRYPDAGDCTYTQNADGTYTVIFA